MTQPVLPAGLRLALGTFTIAPVRPDEPTRTSAGAAMLLAPAVGLLLGGAASAVLLAARVATDARAAPPLLPAVLAVVALALLTRGLHLDGLADTADGLGSMRPPAEAVAVMRRPDIGPFGVTALLLVLLTQVAALTDALAAGRGTTAVLIATVTGRLAVTLSCTPATPAATEGGLGSAVAGTVRRTHARVLTVAVLAGAAVLGMLDGHGDAVATARRVVAVLAGLAVAHVVRRHAVRRLGGITGDVLGALLEVATTVALLMMAAS